MNRHPKKEDRRRQVLPVWTYAQAQHACPYIAGIMRSLREHRLEELRLRLKARRMLAPAGRPTRQSLVAQDDAAREARLMADRVQDDLRELHNLGVYCQDPIRGRALLPFVHGHLLAWFMFDLFASEQIHGWRYHSDADEVCRPISEVAERSAEWMLAW